MGPIYSKTRSARVGPIYYLLWSVSTPNSAQCRSPVGLEGVVVAGGRTEVVVEGTVRKLQNVMMRKRVTAPDYNVKTRKNSLERLSQGVKL